MSSIASPIPAGYSLDYKKDYIKQENGIQCTLLTQLEDLNYADDLSGSPFA